MGKAKGRYFYPGKPCYFMVKNEGCTIYDDHPKLCRMFECAWLTDPTVPEELWPNNSHAIIVLNEMIPQHNHKISEEHRALFDEWRAKQT